MKEPAIDTGCGLSLFRAEQSSPRVVGLHESFRYSVRIVGPVLLRAVTGQTCRTGGFGSGDIIGQPALTSAVTIRSCDGRS